MLRIALARSLLAGTALGARVEAVPSALGLGITLPAGAGRDVIAEINRVLVDGGISVYRLQPVQTSLESWFLQVTSRLEDPNDDHPGQWRARAGAGTLAHACRRLRDRRESPVPTVGMIATRIMELRKRRGLMIALVVLDIGLPALFLLIRLLAHAFAPRANPAAGGQAIFGVLAAGFCPPSASSSPPCWAARRGHATSPRECSGAWW